MGTVVSDPQVWNGTQWVRPSFWMGDRWQAYVDPIYDVPALDDQFVSGTAPWECTGQDFTNPGGYLSAWGYDTFIWGYVAFRLPKLPERKLELSGQAGHMIRTEARYRARPHPDADPPGARSYIGTVQAVIEGGYPYAAATMKLADFPWSNDSEWRTISTPAVAVPSWPRGLRLDVSAYIELNLSSLGGGKPAVYLDLDYFTIWDDTTGTPLMTLGNALWEPYVFNGQRWV